MAFSTVDDLEILSFRNLFNQYLYLNFSYLWYNSCCIYHFGPILYYLYSLILVLSLTAPFSILFTSFQELVNIAAFFSSILKLFHFFFSLNFSMCWLLNYGNFVNILTQFKQQKIFYLPNDFLLVISYLNLLIFFSLRACNLILNILLQCYLHFNGSLIVCEICYS